MDPKTLWQSALAKIKLKLNKAHFITWFKYTKILAIEEGIAKIAVNNNFSKEWLEQKYSQEIKKILKELNPQIKSVEFVVAPKVFKSPSFKKSSLSTQTDLNSYQRITEANLNPRYRFENFVVGSSNELAHAACWGVAENPGMFYNPLFVYGGVGLGKTHLLQAIGNHILEKFAVKKVVYLPSERFISEMVNSIRNNTLEKFKENYKKVDILIIDDIQFIAGKEKTQEEFFHLFNALYQENKQIVISSDRPPKAISPLEERLKSRFEGGMIVDIIPPDFETRLAILKLKAKEKGAKIKEEILEFIAQNVKHNVRELEGLLNQIIIAQEIRKTYLNLADAKKLLEKFIQKPTKTTSPQKVLKVISEYFGISLKDLTSNSRKKEIVKPRQIAMFILREELNCSFPFIGKTLGGKDHTTVMYAVEKLKREVETNITLQEEITTILQRIYSQI